MSGFIRFPPSNSIPQGHCLLLLLGFSKEGRKEGGKKVGVGSREKQQGVVNVNINVAYRLYCVGRKSLFFIFFLFFLFITVFLFNC